MVMASLTYEIKTYGSHYFDPKLLAMMPTTPRNEAQHDNRTPLTFTIFNMKGYPFGGARK